MIDDAVYGSNNGSDLLKHVFEGFNLYLKEIEQKDWREAEGLTAEKIEENGVDKAKKVLEEDAEY